MPSRYCPTCRTRLIRILYGMPSPGGVEAAERGELKIGGCVTEDGQSERWCPSCEVPIAERGGVLVALDREGWE